MNWEVYREKILMAQKLLKMFLQKLSWLRMSKPHMLLQTMIWRAQRLTKKLMFLDFIILPRSWCSWHKGFFYSILYFCCFRKPFRFLLRSLEQVKDCLYAPATIPITFHIKLNWIMCWLPSLHTCPNIPHVVRRCDWIEPENLLPVKIR